MPWVSDSRFAGFLGPDGSPAPLEDDAFDDLMHDLVCGITNLSNKLVFPRWQANPPVHPPKNVDWAAVGIISTPADWQPAIVHVRSSTTHPDGYDAFQRMELDTLKCSFYGPNAGKYAALLRDGLFIDQNVAELRKNNVALVEVLTINTVPDLFKNEWLNRSDMDVIFRREVRRNYPVQNILRAQGTIKAQPPGNSPRLIEDDWDTINEG